MTQVEGRLSSLTIRHKTITDVSNDAATRNTFQIAGPFGSAAELLTWIERSRPAVAILDGAMDGSATDALVAMLRQCGVLVLVDEELRIRS